MKSFGLDDVVRWIEAYLTGRVSRANVGGVISGTIPMHSGLPKDSVIGPLLLLIFVNGLPGAIEALTLLFVDDVKVVTRRMHNMTLQSSLTAAWD